MMGRVALDGVITGSLQEIVDLNSNSTKPNLKRRQPDENRSKTGAPSSSSPSCSNQISKNSGESPDISLSWDEIFTHYQDSLKELSNIPEWVYERLTDEKQLYSVNLIEIREEKGRLNVRFEWRDRQFQMFFSDDTIPIDLSKVDKFLIKRSNKFSAFRSKIMCLPREMKLQKLVLYSSNNLDMEDSFTEGLHLKKWSAVLFEYHIVHVLPSSQHLNRICALFRPTEIILQLEFGSFNPENSEKAVKSYGLPFHSHSYVDENNLGHVEVDSGHDSVVFSKISSQEKAFRITRIGKSYKIGRDIRFTMRAIDDFVKFATFSRKSYEGTIRKDLKKLVIRGPPHDIDCPHYIRTMLTVGRSALLNKKKLFSESKMIPLCIRNYPNIPAKNETTVALALNRCIVPIDDKVFLEMTKTTRFFHCSFQTKVTSKGIMTLLQEWIDGKREIDDMNVHVAELCEELIVNMVKCDVSDMNWFKFKKLTKDGVSKSTLYMGRDKPKVLCLRRYDGK